jgi:DNA-binding HxlR family transcriptional regulator
MPRRDFAGQNCAIADTLGLVGERWTLMIIREILLGRRRFREIQRQTGVAPNILADRLQTLVDAEILRRVGDEPEYRPTRKAVDLQPVLLMLMEWGNKHVPREMGPPRAIYHAACEHEAHPYVVCDHCGEHLDPRETALRPGPGADEAQRADGTIPQPRAA